MPQFVKKVFFYFLIILFSLCTLVWAISPYALPPVVNHFLAPYQLALDEDSSIRYNPFTAHIDIDDLSISTLAIAGETAEIEKVFALKDLEFEMRLYQFLFDDIYISELYIDGLFINITQETDALFIAGVNVSEDNTEQLPQETLPEGSSQAPQPSDDIPYTLYLPNVEIKSSRINVVIDEENHYINFKAFTMNDMELALDEQRLDLAIESEVDDAAFNLVVNGDFSDERGEYFIGLAIENYQLSRVAKHLKLASNGLKGEVSYSAEHKVIYDDGVFELSTPAIKLLLDEAVFQDKEFQFDVGKANVSLSDLFVKFSDITEVDLTGEGLFSISDFKVSDTQNSDVIALLTSLNTHKIELQSVKGKPKVNIEKITFDDFNFSQNHDVNIPALLSIKALVLDQLQVTDTHFHVDNIKLSGVNLDAHIDQDKKLLNLVDALQSQPVEEKTEKEPTNETLAENTHQEEQAPEANQVSNTPQVFTVSLNELSLADDAYIHFWDESISAQYKRKITLNTLDVGQLDSGNPEVETPIKIKGTSNKYAQFNADVLAKPFLLAPEYKFDANVNEVSLPGVSPYLVDALGYEIKSGQLDLSVKGSLQGTAIDSNVDILLRGIALQASEQNKAEKVNTPTVKNEKNGKSVVPFDVALNMLKDSNDNVKLSLPITGDTTDPKFGLSGFISLIVKKAVVLGAREYLIAAVVPYASVLSIAYSAVGENMLRVDINPLTYSPKQIEVGSEHYEFASQFSTLLKEKPDVHVKSCARVVPEDIGKSYDSKLSKDDRKALIILAETRADAFKDYMIQKENTSSSRILLCKPSINQEKGALSQLVFSY